MPDSTEVIAATSNPKESQLVFISHDSRDASLAEAFAKLLRVVSAGMLKSFWSSDKTGREGIEFGDEWYKTLMEKLSAATDVVCLLTSRSLERPWLLYEAGVAKGNRNTPVHGIALGIQLSQASTGPFYQFQNSDDSEESLTKLVLQLCHRVPGLDPDQRVVALQVKSFKDEIRGILNSFTGTKQVAQNTTTETSIAKLLEELKIVVRDIPQRIEHSLLSSQSVYISPFELPRNQRADTRLNQIVETNRTRAIASMNSNPMMYISQQMNQLANDLKDFDALSKISARAAAASVDSTPRVTLKLINDLKEALDDEMRYGDKNRVESRRVDLTSSRQKASDLAVIANAEHERIIKEG